MSSPHPTNCAQRSSPEPTRPSASPHLYRLRPYQQDSLAASREAYERGVNRQLIRWATGMGKTTGCAMHVPQAYADLVEPYGLLFVAHRREILLDTYAKFRRAYPYKTVGLEMGENHCFGFEDFVFASADSVGRVLSSRLQDKYHKRAFGAIITDEGHHVTPGSMWDNVLTYFGVGSDTRHHFTLPNGQKPLSLFLTATPNRHDGQGLYPVVDEIVADYDYAYGVREGWLVDIRPYWGKDMLGVTGAEEAEGVDADFVLRLLRDHAKGHSTLLFARTVPQSRLIVDTLNRMGILRAAHVDAHTDKAERKRMVEAFRAGEIDLLSNWGVFREGTDVPGITMIVDNAPTESQPIHAQKIGRGSRPHPDARVDDYQGRDQAAIRRQRIKESPKPFLVYVATFDPTETPLSVPVTLLGRDDIPQAAEGRLLIEEVLDVVEELEEEQPERPIRDITSLDDLEVALHEVDFYTQNVYDEKVAAITNLQWVFSGEDAALYIEDNPFAERPTEECPVVVSFRKRGDKIEKRLILCGGWNAKLKRPVAKRVDHKGFEDGDLARAISKFDRWLRKNRPASYASLVRGSSAPATDWQRNYMKRHKIGFNENTTEGTADLLIANYRIQHNYNEVDS